MKTTLNISVDKDFLLLIEEYATIQKISISELVEIYFKTLLAKVKEKNIIDLVEGLDRPALKNTADLKELFYKEQAAKYGF